jgi:hypothetical protein
MKNHSISSSRVLTDRKKDKEKRTGALLQHLEAEASKEHCVAQKN